VRESSKKVFEEGSVAPKMMRGEDVGVGGEEMRIQARKV
jgi:hypothetical protein